MLRTKDDCRGAPWLLALCILLAPPAFGQVAAVQPDGARDLQTIAADAGRVLPSASFPYSGGFLLDNAIRLRQGMEDAGNPYLETLIAGIGSPDAMAVDARFTATYQRFARPVYELDYVDFLVQVEPLFTLQLSYQMGLDVALYIEVEGVREFQFGMGPDNLFGSAAGNPMALENNFVRQGFFYAREGPFELTFGRHDVSIGPSPLTSILVSPALPFLDALDLRAHLGDLQMTLLISTLENSTSVPDVTLPPGSPYAFEQTVILFNTHYFEYSFGFLRLGIAGTVIITRPQNAFQLSDFFPVFSWHNANIKPNNLSLVVDASAAPFPGFEVYAQYGFDDINATAFGSNDSGIPTIGAGLIGVGWGSGVERFPFSLLAEIGYTHYLWGSFLDSIPLARAIYRMDLDENDHWIPLTSPYGPGATWLLARATFSTPWPIEAEFVFELVSRNTAASLLGPYEADPVVADSPRTLSMTAGLEIRYEPLRWLQASITPRLRHEEGSTWMELEIEVRTSMKAAASFTPDQTDTR